MSDREIAYEHDKMVNSFDELAKMMVDGPPGGTMLGREQLPPKERFKHLIERRLADTQQSLAAYNKQLEALLTIKTWFEQAEDEQRDQVIIEALGVLTE